MLGAIVVGGILYGLLWLFERKNVTFDGFGVVGAVLVPTMASSLVSFLLFELTAWAGLIGLLVLVVAMFLWLYRLIGLSMAKAAAYTAIGLVLSVVVSIPFSN